MPSGGNDSNACIFLHLDCYLPIPREAILQQTLRVTSTSLVNLIHTNGASTMVGDEELSEL